jgi:1,4-alpha-glucan branching enzyme
VIRIAATIYLLAPEIPLLFMGEEWGATQPFPFFADFEPELAEKVREGRRREFAKFPAFRDEAARARIPDPCAETTFKSAVLDWGVAAQVGHREWLAWYKELLALRRREITPRLSGMAGRSGTFQPLGERALRSEWRLGDGACLTLFANFGDAIEMAEKPRGWRIYGTAALDGKALPARSAFYFISEAARE